MLRLGNPKVQWPPPAECAACRAAGARWRPAAVLRALRHEYWVPDAANPCAEEEPLTEDPPAPLDAARDALVGTPPPLLLGLAALGAAALALCRCCRRARAARKVRMTPVNHVHSALLRAEDSDESH